jgi:plastocyanin
MRAWRRSAWVYATAWLQLPMLFASGVVIASSVEVTVLDRNAEPVADAAVFWRPPDALRKSAPAGTKAVMDQVDTRFVPHVLIVQTGTSVDFPNSDVVAHHVYSFSHPNQFKLPIYKGDAHPPVTFSESGVVILGCNIHDNMLGYILVVDSSAFGKTDANGKVRITTTSNDGEIVIWSPRFRDSADTLAKALPPPAADDVKIAFTLVKPLRPPFDDKSDALSWSDY